MKQARLAIAAILAACITLPAAAYESRVVFQHKNWQVKFVAWDDGSSACTASVGPDNESFSIWTFQDRTLKLQFFSTSWEFGEGEFADLKVRVDRKAPWDLTDAELYKNSVLFTLPDSDDAVRFLMEIADGNRLQLSNSDGSPVTEYSLAGSRASMSAMVDCADGISSTRNPFK